MSTNKKEQSLTIKDLAEQGLQLTKDEATRLLPHISKISQHGASGLNEVEFEDTILQNRQPDFSRTPNLTAEDNNHSGQLNNTTGGGVASVQQSNGFDPTGNNDDAGTKASNQASLQAQENAYNESKLDDELDGKAKEKNQLRDDAESAGGDPGQVKVEMDKTDPAEPDFPKQNKTEETAKKSGRPAKDKA